MKEKLPKLNHYSTLNQQMERARNKLISISFAAFANKLLRRLELVVSATNLIARVVSINGQRSLRIETYFSHGMGLYKLTVHFVNTLVLILKLAEFCKVFWTTLLTYA